MKTSLAFLALAASALASPRPDAVTSAVSPAGSAPAGCSSSFSGNFEVQIVNVTTTPKRETPLEKRVVACGGSGTLVLTLSSGTLTDSIGRTGYIASNRQFQFDAPPQAGAIYTSGWSICGNSSLALGGSAIFYQCLSGTFYNLYDQSTGAQCSQVYVQTVACVGGGASGSASVSSSATVTSSVSSGSAAPVTSSSTSATVTYVAAPPVTTATTYSNGTSSASAVMSGASSGLKSASAVVKQSTDGQPQATTTASAGPALSTGKGSVLAVGKEVLALAAGVAAVFAF